MRHQPPAPITATATPTIEEMLWIWHADRCVQDNSAAVCLQWIRRFRAYTAAHELDERAELTLEGRVDNLFDAKHETYGYRWGDYFIYWPAAERNWFVNFKLTI